MASENPENPVRPNQTTTDSNSEASDHNQEANNSAPPSVASPATQPCPQHPEITCNTNRDWIDKTTLAFEGFGLFLLLVYTVATIIYACITHRQWKEMQTQTSIQRDASINSERAWVGLDGRITIDVLETVPRLKVESHYSIKNFGNGPALKVVPSGWFWTDAKTLSNLADSACKVVKEFTTGTVPHAPNITLPGPIGSTLFPSQPDKETIGSHDDPWQGEGQPGLKHFWFIGCVAYLDQFQVVHWTRFCMEPDFFPHPINKDIPLKFCALYNDTDDPAKKQER